MPVLSRLWPLVLAPLLSRIFLSSLTAATLTQGPEVKVTAESATLTWSTDVSTNTKAAAGATAEALFLRGEAEPGIQHSVTLDGLKPGRTYHYAVGSARQWLGRGTFTTTGGSTAVLPAPSPSVAPVQAKPAPLPTASPGNSQASQEVKKPSIFSQIVSVLKGGQNVPNAAPSAAPPAAKSSSGVATSAPIAPPTQRTWNSMGSLQDHYDRHGPDFGSRSADEYAAQAWQFLQRAKKEGLPMKLDEADGTIRVWDPKTRTFAAYTEHGRTRTYFRPNNPSYWTRQPGRPVSAAQLSF